MALDDGADGGDREDREPGATRALVRLDRAWIEDRGRAGRERDDGCAGQERGERARQRVRAEEADRGDPEREDRDRERPRARRARAVGGEPGDDVRADPDDGAAVREDGDGVRERRERERECQRPARWLGRGGDQQKNDEGQERDREWDVRTDVGKRRPQARGGHDAGRDERERHAYERAAGHLRAEPTGRR